MDDYGDLMSEHCRFKPETTPKCANCLSLLHRLEVDWDGMYLD